MKTKITTGNRQTELENDRQDGSEKSRLILFIIAVVALFMVWGMRVYANNSYTVKQGETKTFTFGESVVVPSPEGGIVSLKAYQGENESDKIEITAVNPAEDSGSNGKFDGIVVKVNADAPAGQYTLNYLQGNNYNVVHPFVNITVEVAAAGDNADSQNSNQQ